MRRMSRSHKSNDPSNSFEGGRELLATRPASDVDERQALRKTITGRENMRLCSARAGVAGVLLILSGAACAETVKVGVIGTFSGGYARWGEQFKQAIAVYQKQNGTSVNNNPIEVVYRDDMGPNPARSKELIADLIDKEKVQFIAGFPWSPNAAAIAQAITDAKMPTILFNAAASAITRQPPYFVRVSFTLPQLAVPLGKWAAEHDIKRAVTAVADFPAGIDAEIYFAK